MQQNIWFLNKKMEKLSGILFYPSKKKLPALVFCHGFASSKHTKMQLANRISKKGFAVLIFDASGCGKSEGKFEDHTISKYVSDLNCAVQFLKKQSFVDRSRIAIAGHSQGGMIVVIFASKYKDASLIFSIDAPYHILKNRGPDSLFGNDAFLDSWKKDGFVKFDVRIAKCKVAKKLAYAFVEDCKKYDLSKLIKKVVCPVVIVQGDADKVVLPEHAKILHKNANAPKELIFVKGVNHRYRKKDEKTLEKILVSGLEKYLNA
jgi:uncharacterized protein